MEIPVVYIGFAQAIFLAIIMFLKKPLKIADVILAVFMLVIAYMFALKIGLHVNGYKEEAWIYSLTISITYPIFLYLYSKYVTVDYEGFEKKDFLHSLPFILTVLIIYIFRNPSTEKFYYDLPHYDQLSWLRNSLGVALIALIWIYGLLALRNINHYRNQLSNIYSYESDLISLNWLWVVSISFIVVENIIIFTFTLYELKFISFNPNSIHNISLLLFLYIAGFWGFRQNQLSSESKAIKKKLSLKFEAPEVLTSEKYQKSGLKNDRAKEYISQLINYMEDSQAWRDNELSVNKIAEKTQIPKHYITQVLNENLGKNFYTFVNEYRLEEAKKMILSPDYSSWSFVAIAFECGFNSKTAFNNFFKKRTGKTPTKFRNRS